MDVYSKLVDHTRESSSLGMSYDFNTNSLRTVKEWLLGLVSDFKIGGFKFEAQRVLKIDETPLRVF